MCTSIIEIARAEGMAKRGDEWFPLSQAVVAYDHARHAPLGDVITLDFINTGLEPGARAGIELTLETAKELRAALDRAIAAAEFEEAEVTGQGRRAQPRSGGVTREMSRDFHATEHSVADAQSARWLDQDFKAHWPPSGWHKATARRPATSLLTHSVSKKSVRNIYQIWRFPPLSSLVPVGRCGRTSRFEDTPSVGFWGHWKRSWL